MLLHTFSLIFRSLDLFDTSCSKANFLSIVRSVNLERYQGLCDRLLATCTYGADLPIAYTQCPTQSRIFKE